jgi:hypothetical protein
LFFGLGSFSRYFRRKQLKSFSFLASRDLPAGEFTVYKRAGATTLCPDLAENLILFNHLPA